MHWPKQFNHPEHASSIILENPFANVNARVLRATELRPEEASEV